MAFGNSGNTDKKQTVKDINTRGTQFYNSDETIGSTVALGFWKETMTIRICPLLPKSKRSDNKTYDYDTFISTALTLEKATLLLMAINDNITPMLNINDYNFPAVGISVGSNFIEVSNGEKHGLDQRNVCLSIYANVDQNGKSADKQTFVFTKKNYFTNYNHIEGYIEKGNDLELDFIIFMNCLKESSKALTNAYAHSSRNVEAYNEHLIRESLNSIKSKLGIESSSSYNKPSSGSNASFFRAGGNNQNNDDEDVGQINNGGTITSGGRLEI